MLEISVIIGTTDRTCLERIRTELQDLTGFGTPDRTCLEGNRTELQDLTGSEHQIVHAYKVFGCGCRISRVRYNSSNMHTMYQDGLAGSHGSEQQIQHAYEISGRGCRISRVGNFRSNMPTRYQAGAAGSHGLGTTHRTRWNSLQGISSGLQDLTGLGQQIKNA